MNKTKKIVFTSTMLACFIVLSRFFSIKIIILVISFSFIPMIIIAYTLGYKYAALIGFLGDLIGALLFPMGEYFVGFTISATLSGLIYGLILHNNKKEYKGKQLVIRLIISSSIVCLIVNGLLNTLWLYIITGKAFLALLPTRIIKELIMIPIIVITMTLLLKHVNLKALNND